MKTRVLVLLTSAVMLLALGAGNAWAQSVQSADQKASTGQSASSESSATQSNPTNSVVDIRIGSPGDNGDIEQSNSNSASSAAGNEASTGQSAAQGAGSGASVQSALQHAATAQEAASRARADQSGASNGATVIRIQSPGKDGSVKQSNSNDSHSRAGNAAATRQGVAQGGGSSGGAGVQSADQRATTEQGARSGADAEQVSPSNDVTRIRIHSAGDNGAVKQSNSNSAASKAANEALTEQGVEQGSGGSGAYGGTQYAGQHASTDQSAASRARAVQRRPSNSVDSVRIDSPGDDGDITQSNDNSASSVAGNAAATGQSVSQGGGSGSGSGVQASDQSASTSQDADSAARARQRHPSNSAGGTRISSPGGGGSIDQSNSNSSASEAANAAETVQNTAQGAGGETVRSTRCSSCSAVAGRAVQAAGQDADTRQGARSGADATQSDATNSAGGTRIGSEGDEGDVRQSNDNKSASAAGNKSRTWQTLTQAIAGLFGVQAAGQDATTRQGAASAADATQDAPCNTVAPVRLYSMGGLGSIGQYNANNGVSMAGNAGATLQQALQLV